MSKFYSKLYKLNSSDGLEMKHKSNFIVKAILDDFFKNKDSLRIIEVRKIVDSIFNMSLKDIK